MSYHTNNDNDATHTAAKQSLPPVEKERKFLVDPAKFERFMDNLTDEEESRLGKEEITQTYLAVPTPGPVSFGAAVRVRSSASGPLTVHTLTVKTPRSRSGESDEVNILLEDEKASWLHQMGVWPVYKTRYHVFSQGRGADLHWEVDVFDGALDGLIIAELEGDQPADPKLPWPEFIGKEVTGDKRYSNACLAEKGLP